MTVNVTFDLSPAGQRASLIAGGNGAAHQTVPMDASPADLASPRIAIAASGEMSLAVPGSLDAPPAGLADALALVDGAAKAAEEAALAAVDAYEGGGDRPDYLTFYQDAALRQRVETEDARRSERRQAELRAARIQQLQALSPDAGMGTIGMVSSDRAEQVEALGEDRIAAAEAIAAEARAKTEAEKERKATELAADAALDTKYFVVSGGLCGFLAAERVTHDGEKIKGWHYGWASYDQKHWLGVFTEARGISRFLSGPRGEKCYDISDLSVGECIQQASFSTNSRGKRRDEDENFAVVVLAQPDRIGIHVCASRAEALKFAAKL